MWFCALEPTIYRLNFSNAVHRRQHDLVIEIFPCRRTGARLPKPPATHWAHRVGAAHAAAAGFYYSAHLLLSAFADPNVVGSDSCNALHLATCDCIRLLLDYRADVHFSDFGSALGENVLLVRHDALAPDAESHVPLLCSHEADGQVVMGDTIPHECPDVFQIQSRRLSSLAESIAVELT